MKASNTQVMVQAYRLLVQKMIETNRNYPLHLGVTEAGEGEDGRIKSAVGIGTLLEDGLGDTVRVSLTEEPEFEIPIAKALVDRYSKREKDSRFKIQDLVGKTQDEGFKTQNSKFKTQNSKLNYNPFEYNRRETNEVLNFGKNNVPRIITDFSGRDKITAASLFALGYNYSVPLDKWNLSDLAVDYIFVGENTIDFEIPGTLGFIYPFEHWKKLQNPIRSYPLFHWNDYFTSTKKSNVLNFVEVGDEFLESNIDLNTLNETVVLIIKTNNIHRMPTLRSMINRLLEKECKIPVIIKNVYHSMSEQSFQLYSSTDFGGLLLDGFGDGIWIEQKECVSPQICNSTAFGILQATRTRISKTEYISCPSCGRTLFDLQETTAKIRERTDHLKGIKIGIMGCIVNGPGEMADADYGYVGTGVGKISLYKGKVVVKKNVTAETAVNELIELIKEHGDWVEKVI
jgi:(E)-4-hydroxy-3-methylbut-2-enyl-diphosphate synthase